MKKQTLFILSTLLFSSLYGETEEYQTFESKIPRIQVPAGHLYSIIEKYDANPQAELSDQDILDLTNYAAYPNTAYYDFLIPSERTSLAQILNLYNTEFDPEVVYKFNRQEKEASGMTSNEITALELIMIHITEKEILSTEEINAIKGLEKHLLHSAYAFIPELPLIIAYANQNPSSFTLLELETYRQTSRRACSITDEEMEIFRHLSKTTQPRLSPDDIDALNRLATKASIGSLSGLPPELLISLKKVMEDNSDRFDQTALSRFNSAVD